MRSCLETALRNELAKRVGPLLLKLHSDEIGPNRFRQLCSKRVLASVRHFTLRRLREVNKYRNCTSLSELGLPGLRFAQEIRCKAQLLAQTICKLEQKNSEARRVLSVSQPQTTDVPLRLSERSLQSIRSVVAAIMALRIQ